MTDDHDPTLERRLRDRFAAIPPRLPPDVADALSARMAATDQARGRPIVPLVLVAAAVAIGAIAAMSGALRSNPVLSPTPTGGVSAAPSPSVASQFDSLAAGAVVRATADIALDVAGGWTIHAGQKAFVVEGPFVDATGDSVYRLQTWGDLTNGIKPDTVFGLIDADSAEADLVPAPPRCPDGEPMLAEVARLHPFERLVCFGARELTFGPVTASTVEYGGKTSSRWISAEGRPDFFTGLPYYSADATIAIADGEFVTVTGHFDEPSSANCGDLAAVTWCRERFFITSATPAEVPAFVLRGAWREIALPPISGRTEHRLVWTGSEVLVWGGYASDENTSVFDANAPSDGAAYDPAADSWRLIPAAPIAGRGQPIVAWTGTEMLAFGGFTRGESATTAHLDGAAYDPDADRWRLIPPAPLTGDEPLGGWVAGRLVVVTSTAAAAYDPVADRWTSLPPAPIRPDWRSAVVAGGRLVVIAFGDGATPPVQEATLDPATWTWASAHLTMDPLLAGIDFVGIGDRLLSPSTGMIFDPTARVWASVTPCERVWGGIWTGRNVIGIQGAWDAATNRCLDVPPSPPRQPPFDDTNGREFATAVWTGEEYITWSGGTGGDIVWVPKDGAAFRPEP